MKLYKFYPADKPHTIDNILRNQLYFSLPRGFEDPLDSNLCIISCSDIGTAFDLRGQSDTRVTCLTKEQSDYMWQHFGGDGNGFCLEYDDSYLRSKISKDIIEVEYYPEPIIEAKLNNGLSKYVSSGFDKKLGYCLLIAAFQYKRIEFQEEKEFRVLSKREVITGIVPRKIIIGNKVNTALKSDVSNHCSLYKIGCEVRKV